MVGYLSKRIIFICLKMILIKSYTSKIIRKTETPPNILYLLLQPPFCNFWGLFSSLASMLLSYLANLRLCTTTCATHFSLKLRGFCKFFRRKVAKSAVILTFLYKLSPFTYFCGLGGTTFSCTF